MLHHGLTEPVIRACIGNMFHLVSAERGQATCRHCSQICWCDPSLSVNKRCLSRLRSKGSRCDFHWIWNFSERILEGFGPFQDGEGLRLAGFSCQPRAEEQTMTDFPIGHSASANRAGQPAPAFARLTALFQAACGAVAQAVAQNAQRRAMRRAPEEILMAQARREEARRATDRLLQRR
jgi:hypothetical protein